MKYNGRNITVTEANKIEYIHLMADYKINKQVYINMLMYLRNLNMKISKSNFKVLVFFTFSGPIYFFVVIFWGGFIKFQSFEDM